MKRISDGLLICILLLLCFSAAVAQSEKIDKRDVLKEFVTNLPAISKIEILAVKGSSVIKPNEMDCSKPDIVCGRFSGQILASKTLSGEEAKKLSKLWRNLKNGNGAGCFAPAYVLRFYNKDGIMLTADVCFHCCNITLPESGICSICGDKTAIKDFRGFVTGQVPFPKQGREN